jgi:carboxypeptidase PM20D1
MKKILIFITALLIALTGVLVFNTLSLKSKQLVSANGVPLQLPVDQNAVEHLSQAIQINTISFADSIKMAEAQPRFDSFIRFMKSTYPLVFTSLEDTIINGRNILLEWKGSDASLPPAILYAHMDVVPIEQNTIAQWKHAPFSGDVADGYIWGRGALDDKGSLISIFEALTRCLQKGLKPQQSIYIASGSDEEVGGNTGAEAIAQYCRENKLHFGFYEDEGLMVTQGVVPNMKKDVALIGTAEKGYITVELMVNMPGGHSSKPQKETALDVLIKAVKKVHDRPFEKMVSPSTDEFIDYLAYEMPMPLKLVFANKWLFKSIILSEYAKTDAGNALVRTTGVATVMNAGLQDNVIPTQVSAKINFRILPGQTTQQVEEKVKEIIADNRVHIIPGEKVEPSQSTPANSWGFKLLQKTSAEVFPDAVVAPALMIGSTDSKHFTGLTDETYRFFPTRMDNEAIGSFHGINERIKIPYFMETIRFYETLLNNMQTFSAENRK